MVPGLEDSGPEHRQSLWQGMAPVFRRIAQRRWDHPDIELWIATIPRHLRLREGRRPAVLIGHSPGAPRFDPHRHGSCGTPVAGLVLVAPAEPSRFEAEERVPERDLDGPSLLVASHDDPVMRFHRAERWTRVWGSRLTVSSSNSRLKRPRTILRLQFHHDTRTRCP